MKTGLLKNKSHLADLVDGSIGELSPFHETFGYYAHGVARDTVVLPDGWEQRLIPIKMESGVDAINLTSISRGSGFQPRKRSLHFS